MLVIQRRIIFIMNLETVRIWKDAVVVYLRYYSDVRSGHIPHASLEEAPPVGRDPLMGHDDTFCGLHT